MYHLLANLTYLQLIVADYQDKPIQNVFPEVFEFIKSATEPASDEAELAPIEPTSEMAYPNSTATVLLNYSTHLSEVKMNA